MQQPLIDFSPRFDGETFSVPRDQKRTESQLQRVRAVLERGGWMTAAYIASVTGDRETSVGSRCRDFRKGKFGALNVESRNVGGGQWEYRLVLPGAPS